MGIFRFFKWFRNKFSDNIIKLKKNETFIDKKVQIDTLLLDLNGIFHTSAQKIYKYGSFKRPKSLLCPKPKLNINTQNIKVYQDICFTIEDLILRVNPTKRVILCIDGVAPASKMNQQRKRRYKAVIDSKNNDTEFDSNCITPGTRFMDNLSKYIDWYLKKQISENSKWKSLEIIFSNEKVPSEGEHKLLNYLRLYGIEQESYCMVGGDADLIMLGLSSHKKNFYILREDQFDDDNAFFIINIGDVYLNLSDKMNWIKSINREIEQDDNKLKEYKNTIIPDFNIKDSINDFIFMCFMIGNDFLCNIPGIEIDEGGIDEMLNVYINIGKSYGHLTTYDEKLGTKLIHKNVEKFMNTMGLKEQFMIEEKLQHKDKYFENKLLDNNSAYDNLSGRFMVDIDSYKNDYYKNNLENIDIETLCHSYIEGLQWVLSYYTKGVQTWDYIYNHHYAPFISDLGKYMKTYIQPSYLKTSPVLPFVQLLCVLPPQSSSLIPTPLSNLLTDSKSLIFKNFKDIKIDLSGKRYEYEGVVLLPFIEKTLIIDEYNKISSLIDKKESKRNIIGCSFIYKYDENTSDIFKSYYGTINDCKVILTKIIF